MMLIYFRRLVTISGVLIFLATFFARPTFAVMPDEKLNDPALEARASAISQTLRCVVCQNQNIDSSSAPLARDMRILLRQRISVGDSDKEATDYLVQRYGNFVLLKPPFQLDTIVLWIFPFVVLLIAGFAFFWPVRRLMSEDAIEELAPIELEQIHALIDQNPKS